MSRQRTSVAAFITGIVACLVLPVPGRAQTDKTPDFATTVPGSWSTDRYTPCDFALSNGVNGRNNVAQIGVCSGDFQGSGSFYDFQGETIGVDPVNTTPPASQSVSMDLYLDPAWADAANGLVSTSMWTRVNQVNSDAEATAWYPIIAYTNSKDVGGEWEYWNSTLGWEDLTALGATMNYGAWNTVSLVLTGNTFDAYVNGADLYTETADPGTTRLTNVFLEDYNYPSTFTADWSNTQVTPEPGTLSLLAMGLVGLGGAGMRKRLATTRPTA